MIYYISGPESTIKNVKEKLMDDDKASHYLLSFATSSKHFDEFYRNGKNTIMIDSGAFSAWNSGKIIDREEYLAYCKKLPEEVYKINLDVIPQTGSSVAEKLKCTEESFKNFVYLKKHLKNVLPVHHYGEDISLMKRFVDECDYICISPANDTSEKIKRNYFKYLFSQIPLDVKTHALGYSSFSGCGLFPFYSVDSIAYKRTQMYGDLIYRKSDGSYMYMSIWDYAKMNGIEYDRDAGMAANKELLEEATYFHIQNLLNRFKELGEINKTKNFNYLKQQLTLF